MMRAFLAMGQRVLRRVHCAIKMLSAQGDSGPLRYFTVSVTIMFVFPGLPAGTPAVMITISPTLIRR